MTQRKLGARELQQYHLASEPSVLSDSNVLYTLPPHSLFYSALPSTKHCTRRFQVDPYNTQSAIALLRQHMEYEHQYDLAKLSLKNIANTQVCWIAECFCLEVQS